MRAPVIPEREWQRSVTDLLSTFGWSFCHVEPLIDRNGRWRNPASAKGWPDLLAVKGPWLVVAELKGSRTPSPSPSQIAWLMRFAELPCSMTWVLRAGKVSLDDIAGWLARPADPATPWTFGWEPLTVLDPAFPR